ncbi:hypothetical protein BGX23_000008 [Mortierella sp. AD031]|nr:hypothetical protein BGX23_000008 [Mortierella sp. AD031]
MALNFLDIAVKYRYYLECEHTEYWPQSVFATPGIMRWITQSTELLLFPNHILIDQNVVMRFDGIRSKYNIQGDLLLELRVLLQEGAIAIRPAQFAMSDCRKSLTPIGAGVIVRGAKDLYLIVVAQGFVCGEPTYSALDKVKLTHLARSSVANCWYTGSPLSPEVGEDSEKRISMDRIVFVDGKALENSDPARVVVAASRFLNSVFGNLTLEGRIHLFDKLEENWNESTATVDTCLGRFELGHQRQRYNIHEIADNDMT